MAIKELQDFTVLIVDPERRAASYIFEHDPAMSAAVKTNTLSEMANSL